MSQPPYPPGQQPPGSWGEQQWGEQPAGYPQGYPTGPAGYPQPDYSQQAYQQPGYPQPDYSQQAYQQPGYPQPDYSQQAYQQPGFQQGQYPAGYPQPGYQQPGMQPPARGTNGFAIASLIFGLLGGVLLAVIFGIIALQQTKRRNQAGRGLAITGIVLSGVWVLVIAIIVVAVVVSDSGRSDAGEITEGGPVSTTSLQVGDCLNDLDQSGSLQTLPAVPCEQPHEGEVFALFDIPGSEFPGEPAVIAQAESGCVDRLPSYAPNAAQDPSITVFYLYPGATAWDQGDHEIVCLATATSGTLTGSLRDR